MAPRSSSYRVGMVAAGNISRLHLDGISRHADRLRCVAICDPDEPTLEARAADYSIEQTYTSLDEMIAEAQLDAAVVGTPTHVRRECCCR